MNCPVCFLGSTPQDGKEHKAAHNRFVREACLVSRFEASQRQVKRLRDVAYSYLIHKLTGLSFVQPIGNQDRALRVPIRRVNIAAEQNQHCVTALYSRSEDAPALLILGMNRLAVDLKDEPWAYMIPPMAAEGFMDSVDNKVWCLTRAGFAALAGCLETDLICFPDRVR